MKTFALLLCFASVGYAAEWTQLKLSAHKCPGGPANHLGLTLSPSSSNSWFATGLNYENHFGLSVGSEQVVQSQSNSVTSVLYDTIIHVEYPDICEDHGSPWPFATFSYAGAKDGPSACSFNHATNAVMPAETPMFGLPDGHTVAEFECLDDVSDAEHCHHETPHVIGVFSRGPQKPKWPGQIPHIELNPPPKHGPPWTPYPHANLVTVPGATFTISAGSEVGTTWTYETSVVTDELGIGQSADLTSITNSTGQWFWRIVCTNLPSD